MQLMFAQVTVPFLRSYDCYIAIDRSGRFVEGVDAGPQVATGRSPGAEPYLIRQLTVVVDTTSPVEIETLRGMVREAKGLPAVE